MRNIDVYDGDSFEFYKKVCNAKRDVDLKGRLLLKDNDINQLYGVYDNHYHHNILEETESHGYINLDKIDLHALYKYKSAAIQKLCIELTTSENKRKMRCQNCTIGEVGSLDHLLPKEQFPEFAVNPKNLFPSCTKCNSLKGDIWKNENGRTTLNLYIDTLPEVQYLFVQADIGNTTIDIAFYLENRTGIEDALFKRIENHYENLNLFDRFAENVDEVITSFKNTLEPWIGKIDVEILKEKTLETLAKERLVYGYNFWQTILKCELINNDDFMIDFYELGY